jgi:hypothetical protein
LSGRKLARCTVDGCSALRLTWAAESEVTMIRWIRTARIASGDKFGKAMEFAEITKGMTKKYPQIAKIEVFLDALGDTSNIRWVIDYPDFATFDKVQQVVLKDADYWKLMAAYADVFIPGSVNDVAMRQI